jgi:hypothetical protein
MDDDMAKTLLLTLVGALAKQEKAKKEYMCLRTSDVHPLSYYMNGLLDILVKKYIGGDGDG